MTSKPEAYSYRGAVDHAQRIERYWTSKGHPDVRAWVEKVGHIRGLHVFTVRTNLVSGLPPRLAPITKPEPEVKATRKRKVSA